MLLCFKHSNKSRVYKKKHQVFLTVLRKCYYTNNSLQNYEKRKTIRMCNKMSINTADFAALTITVVLFADIYYLDYKKGVDFGLLTLLGTVLNRSWSPSLKIIYTCWLDVSIQCIDSTCCTKCCYLVSSRKYHKSKRIHSFKIGGKSIFYLILNTAIASTITVIAAVILKLVIVAYKSS